MYSSAGRMKVESLKVKDHLHRSQLYLLLCHWYVLASTDNPQGNSF